MSGGMSIHFNGPFSNGVTFSPIAAKFQTGDGSYEFDSTITNNNNNTTSTDVAAVPEPASMVLLGSGLVLAAARLRRARQARS